MGQCWCHPPGSELQAVVCVGSSEHTQADVCRCRAGISRELAVLGARGAGSNVRLGGRLCRSQAHGARRVCGQLYEGSCAFRQPNLRVRALRTHVYYLGQTSNCITHIPSTSNPSRRLLSPSFICCTRSALGVLLWIEISIQQTISCINRQIRHCTFSASRQTAREHE